MVLTMELWNWLWTMIVTMDYGMDNRQDCTSKTAIIQDVAWGRKTGKQGEDSGPYIH